MTRMRSPLLTSACPLPKSCCEKVISRQRHKPHGLRITNIGCADAVSKQIATLGLNVTNSNEQMQTKWDADMKEMVYLIVIAAFCLMSASLMLAANRAVMLERQKQAFEMLRWLGMKDRSISLLFLLNAFIVSVLGALIGLVVSLSLPSFLPARIKRDFELYAVCPFYCCSR